MKKILVAARDPDLRRQVAEDLGGEPELGRFEHVVVDSFASLLKESVKGESALIMLDYGLSPVAVDAGDDEVSETVEVARDLNESQGVPVLFIGPVERPVDDQVIKLRNDMDAIKLDDMFMLALDSSKPFFIAKILAMIAGVRKEESDKPRGLIELTISDDDTVRCATMLIYRGGRFLNCFNKNFHYDSHFKKHLEYLTKQLSKETDRDDFIGGYEFIGRITRNIMNYDEGTKWAINNLVHKSGGVDNVWIRFRVPYRNMSQIPFEAVLRCDHFEEEEEDDTDFQLRYSPVYRVVGNPSAAGKEPRFPILSGLQENSPERINCLVIDATSSGLVDNEQHYPDMPDMLPEISENARKEIEFVTEIFQQMKDTGVIFRFEQISFATEAEKEDPSAALDRVIRSDKWDIIHFNGHSIYLAGDKPINDRGYVFLPGKIGAVPVPIKVVADWFNQANLVYMSSCQSAEPAFVNALAERGIPTIIGFRWQVSSNGAAQFAGLFYHNLFHEKTGNIEPAFVEAQRCLMDPDNYPLPDDLRTDTVWTNPDIKAWASPMLVMQNV